MKKRRLSLISYHAKTSFPDIKNDIRERCISSVKHWEKTSEISDYSVFLRIFFRGNLVMGMVTLSFRILQCQSSAYLYFTVRPSNENAENDIVYQTELEGEPRPRLLLAVAMFSVPAKNLMSNRGSFFFFRNRNQNNKVKHPCK